MFQRIARRSVVTVVVVAGALSGLPRGAGARAGVLLPDVHQVLQRTANVEQAYKIKHCIVHFESGTFAGTAYSYVRVTHEDPGYVCTYATQVLGVREGDELITGPQSDFSCAAPTPKPCFAADYYRWARSTLPNASFDAASIQVSAIRSWPPPHLVQRNYATLSAG
jgi:hypothetical protein